MEDNNIQIKYKGKIVSLEEIINNPSKYNIETITVSYSDSLNNTEYSIVSLGTLEITSNPSKSEEINEQVRKIIKNLTSNKLTIVSKTLINKELIETISENDHLKKVRLTFSYAKENEQYKLTEEDYEILKKSKIPKEIITPKIEEELTENFDPIIGYNSKRILINRYNYQKLQELEEIYLRNNLSNEEISNLKYLPSQTKITIMIKDVKNIELILNRLLELDSQNEIIIKIENKEIFNKSEIYLNSEKYSKLNIRLFLDKNLKYNYSLREYKRFEEIIYTFIKPAIDRNYSPFERYIYAYNIAKKFKLYEENKNNLNDSRDLYKILINEYMVCVGYSKMFRDLLEKLGISTIDKSVTVTTNNPNEEIVNKDKIEFGEHARAYSHIKDEKYGIDGYYIADPTWDNSLEQDLYIYAALTNQEINNNFRMLKIITNNEDMLLDSENKEDFYQRLDRSVERSITKRIKKNKNITKDDYRTEIYRIYLEKIRRILDIIKKLDIEKYQEITNKYNIPIYLSNNNLKEFAFLMPEILDELCDYILSKVNKPISGQTIIDAAMVINKDIFNLTEQQTQELRKNLINTNNKRQNINFPTIKIKNQTTGEVTYQAPPNKFNITEQKSNHHQK